MFDPSHSPSPDTRHLHRAHLAIEMLSRSGLGDLNWVGPGWICAFSEIDESALDYLLRRIEKDFRLRRDILLCQSQRDLRLLQTDAIRRALEEYAAATGRPRVRVPKLAAKRPAMAADATAGHDSD